MLETETETELELVIRKSRSLRPRTKELYLRCVRSFLTFAGTEPKRWTPTTVQAWRDYMRRRRVKPQSRNVALNALRFAARKQGGNLAKFADRASEALPTRTVAEGRALTEDEGKRLVAACRGTARDARDMAIIVMGLHTGMLRFSMCQLRLEDLRGGKLTFVKKGGKEHTIKLDPSTQAACSAWTAWLRSHDITTGALFRSLGRSQTDGMVRIGKGLTPDGLYRAVQQRAEKAEVKDLNPYVFRKTFLEWARKAGCAPQQIAMVTGYTSDGIVPPGSRDLPANFLLPDLC